MDAFKTTPSMTEKHEVAPVAIRSHEGDVLDASALSNVTNIKTSKDGKIILVPQPSSDPNDTLNWSWKKKHTTLFVISAAAFLPDFGSGIGAVTLIPQAVQWGITQDDVLRSLIGNLLMLGIGGVLVVILMSHFGRLPVLFWFLIMAVWTAALCAASPTLDMYIGARVLNGTFSTVAQGGGLFFINDMFFAHEHARKINIWSFAVILSPYLGPLVTALIISRFNWPWAFWLLTLLTGIVLILVALFLDETYYDRSIPQHLQPARKKRILRVLGIEQWQSRAQRISLGKAIVKSVRTLLKPIVFLSVLYYMLIFAWVVGVNTTLSIFLQPLYGFGPQQIGIYYLTPIIATILGEITGHWIHDQFAAISVRRSHGHLVAEARLHVLYVATPFMIAGLVLLGYCLQYAYHYMVTALGWGLYVFGIMLATVGVNAYLLTGFPEASGEVAAWLNFARTAGGFWVTLFQVRWAHKTGPKSSFSTQAGVIAAAFLIVIFLQLYGPRIRKWSGPVTW